MNRSRTRRAATKPSALGSKIHQNPTLSEGLSPKQTEGMQALLLGATVTHAAARAGVDRSTLYRWLNDDPKFHGELTRIKRERFESARAQIRNLSEDAVKTIRALITGAKVPAAVRLKAALAVLEAVGALEVDAAEELREEEVVKRTIEWVVTGSFSSGEKSVPPNLELTRSLEEG